MQDLTGRLTPTHNDKPAAIVTSPSTTCGSLFTDPAGDDSYALEGQSLAAPGEARSSTFSAAARSCRPTDRR